MYVNIYAQHQRVSYIFFIVAHVASDNNVASNTHIDFNWNKATTNV